jgi:DNA-binding winged helix-turn-helix (wHTH) protein
MTNLRRCLGEHEQGVRYIANVPGQGYSFVAPVSGPESSGQQRRATQMCSRSRRIIHERETATTIIR